MSSTDFLPHLHESLTAKRVYSDPIQQNGVTIITAAAVRGGGGVRNGGERIDRGGLGLAARPVGAYVVRGSEVKWKPAFDLSRAVFRGQLVVLTAFLALAWLRSAPRTARWRMFR